MLTFKVAVGLAFVMVLLAAIAKRWSMGYMAIVLLYLIGAALAPVVFVPLGFAVVLIELLNTSGGVTAWLQSITGNSGSNPQTGIDENKIGVGAH